MIFNEKFKQLREIEAGINKNLFLICSLVTIVVMAMMVLEFFSRGAFPPHQMNLFYLGVLILYSLHKEMVRWLGKRKIERQGEYFVYGWIGLTTSFYLINFLTKGYFGYSPEGDPAMVLGEASLLTLEVLVIFIFTRVLKLLKIFITKTKE